MIVTVRDLFGGADISDHVERDSKFSVEATFGSRMDILSCVIHDPDLTYAMPDRREIIVYDTQAMWEGGTGDVVDPPWAISAYNILHNGPGPAITSIDSTTWTPRLFAGYLATPEYQMSSTERMITISAQDYTYRLRSTIINQHTDAGLTDQAVVRAIFATARPDFNTDNVAETFSTMPALSFPVSSLEQLLQRIIKLTRAVYRVDYYKCLWYGPISQFVAPFSLAEAPDDGREDLYDEFRYDEITYDDDIARFGFEQAVYSPDAASLSDRVWVVGKDFMPLPQTYDIQSFLVDGATYQFSIPGAAIPAQIVSVTVNGVAQTFGADGDITDQSTFLEDVLVAINPPLIAFKVTPTAGQTIEIIADFQAPLVLPVEDASLLADTGGLLFDAIVRSKAIRDITTAREVGAAYLAAQGTALKGLTCTVMQRGWTPAGRSTILNLAPGQTIDVTAPMLFAGLCTTDELAAGSTKTFVVTRATSILDDQNDLQHPYRVELELADRISTGGQ